MITDFPLHAADLGYRVTEPIIADGRIHRVNWKPGSGSSLPGWYVAFDRGDWGAVVWGDWRDAWQETWTSRSVRHLSQAERAAVAAQTAAAREAEGLERQKAAESAQRKADWLWGDAQIQPAAHDYLTRKQITGTYVRLRHFDGRDELLVPLRDRNFSLCNLQRIQPDGTKLFVRNAGVAGMHWRTGPLPPEDWSGDIALAEGVATAETVREIAGVTCFASITAGNLPSVAAWLRERWPVARLLIAADDDRWEKDGTPRPAEKNAGRVKAAQAAETTRALVLLPGWNNMQSRGTDWNDLLCEEGREAARAKWANTLAIAVLDRQVALMSDTEYASRRAALMAAYATAGAGRLGARQMDQRRRERRTTDPAAAEGQDESPAATLTRISSEPEFWHDQFGRAFSTFPFDGVFLNAPVEGQLFRDWLRMSFEDENGGAVPPSRDVVGSIVEQVAARARARAPMRRAHYRVALENGAHWLDLGQDTWSAVRWDSRGWELVARPEVKFTRGDGDCALPVPLRNEALGALEPLWKIINVHEEDRCLLAGFLLGAMLADAPCFGLDLHGGQGTAKSTATRILRRLIDPSPGLTQPLNADRVDELGITCLDQRIPCFENISYLEDEVQDALCALTTGMAIRNRKLYSDNTIMTYVVQRPWIINGINNVCSRNDLAERAIPVGLQAIPPENRMTEGEVEREFAAIHAHCLAVLLDAAVNATAGRESARQFLAAKGFSHRMADAVEWITAGEAYLGFPAGSFIARLDRIQEDNGREAMEGNPVIAGIEALLNASSRQPPFWKGTHEDILLHLDDFMPKGKRPRHLPHDSRSLGHWIKREGGRLRKSFGIEISERIKARKDGRLEWIREIQRIPNHTPPDEHEHAEESHPDFD